MSGLTVVFYVKKTPAVETLGGAENKMGRPLLISDRQHMRDYDSGPGYLDRSEEYLWKTKSARLVERDAGVFMYSLA